jgi:hypothetical protein
VGVGEREELDNAFNLGHAASLEGLLRPLGSPFGPVETLDYTLFVREFFACPFPVAPASSLNFPSHRFLLTKHTPKLSCRVFLLAIWLTIEGNLAEGWRVVDRRRQHFPVAHRGRSSGGGRWMPRGRASWDGRGRSSWHGRSGRSQGPDATFGYEDRAAVQPSRGGQIDVVRKRVADGVSGVADMGKKRQEDLCCEICEDIPEECSRGVFMKFAEICEICCEICEDLCCDIPEECSVFNGLKSQEALCGFAGGESGFFQVSTWGVKAVTPRSDGVTAFITVKEGNVSAELVKFELSRLIHVMWNWFVQKHANGFIVSFPCTPSGAVKVVV